MEVLLTQEVSRLGKAGQKVNVKDGFGRNYLIPRGLAVAAGRGAGSAAQARGAAQLRAAAMVKEKAAELGRRLAEARCDISVSVGEQGKLHGSVTPSDVVEALEKQGIAIEKHQIQMERPLTHPGEYPIVVRLHPEVKATLRVVLKPEGV